MIVEELVAVLGVQVDQASVSRVSSAFDSFGKVALGLAGVVAGAFAGVANMVYKTAIAGDDLGTVAEKLGITATSLQELNYAAELSDTSVESLQQGMKFLAKNAADAAAGSSEAAKAFSGIQLKDGGKIRDVDALLADISDKFVALPDAASKTNLAMKIFGRSGADMIPFLNRGSAGIAALRVEAERMGYVLSTDAVAAGQAFDDAWKRLNATLTGWRNRLAGPLIEKFTSLVVRLTGVLGRQGGVLDTVSKAFGRLLDGVEWFLANDGAIHVAIYGIVTALSAWALSALSAAVASGALSAASVAAAVSAAVAWLSAVGPLILFGAIIALIIDDLYTFSQGGKSAIGELIKALDRDELDDTKLERLLKRLGGLTFDFSNPVRWLRLGDAVKAVTDQVALLLDLLGQTGVASVIRAVGAFAPAAAQRQARGVDILTGGDGDISGYLPQPFASASADARTMPGPVVPRADPRAGGGSVVNTFAPQISIVAPAGGDIIQLKNLMQQTVQEQWDGHMRSTAAQTGGPFR